MISIRIARRYAKALLAIGREDGQAETYKEELGGFVELLEEQKELEQAISNPLYDAEGRKRVLQAVVERSGVSKVMTSFLFLLFDKGRIQYLKDIYDFYEKLTDEVANIVRADLVSATDFPEETIEKIRAALAQMTGKEVKMDVRVDPALVGGAVTKIGDLVLDGSVRTQLKTLKESLQRSENI
ncbi:MAG: F0F1 ATP synthase subunit delta [Desulfobacterales bacterium]|nr:MAG: F0F1 ATP synthase subunit delta [Desulfobacterales bacterium]